MEDKPEGLNRRAFLKSAVAGSAAAATAVTTTVVTTAALPASAQAQGNAAAPPASASGYAFLNPEEAAFVEAMVDHMIPADDLTPSGVDLGINIYIDRSLAGAWGKGDRLYMQGPWKQGTPSQGYQLPLTPAELYRNGIAAANEHCVKTYGKPFDKVTAAQREDFLRALRDGKVAFENGPPARVFLNTAYQTVMEGMFADPIYGGNRDKAGWKLIGFPGVIAVHSQDVEKYRDKAFVAKPVGIADMS